MLDWWTISRIGIFAQLVAGITILIELLGKSWIESKRDDLATVLNNARNLELTKSLILECYFILRWWAVTIATWFLKLDRSRVTRFRQAIKREWLLNTIRSVSVMIGIPYVVLAMWPLLTQGRYNQVELVLVATGAPIIFLALSSVFLFLIITLIILLVAGALYPIERIVSPSFGWLASLFGHLGIVKPAYMVALIFYLSGGILQLVA